MLSKVTAKNVGDVFFETHCSMSNVDHRTASADWLIVLLLIKNNSFLVFDFSSTYAVNFQRKIKFIFKHDLYIKTVWNGSIVLMCLGAL